MRKQMYKAFKKCCPDNNYYLPLENLYYRWKREQERFPCEERGNLLQELSIFLEDKSASSDEVIK